MGITPYSAPLSHPVCLLPLQFTYVAPCCLNLAYAPCGIISGCRNSTLGPAPEAVLPTHSATPSKRVMGFAAP